MNTLSTESTAKRAKPTLTAVLKLLKKLGENLTAMDQNPADCDPAMYLVNGRMVRKLFEDHLKNSAALREDPKVFRLISQTPALADMFLVRSPGFTRRDLASVLAGCGPHSFKDPQ